MNERRAGSEEGKKLFSFRTRHHEHHEGERERSREWGEKRDLLNRQQQQHKHYQERVRRSISRQRWNSTPSVAVSRVTHKSTCYEMRVDEMEMNAINFMHTIWSFLTIDFFSIMWLQKCLAMSHSKISQDSEPLIEPSSTSSSPPLAKNNRWRSAIGRRSLSGFNLRRKDAKGYQERCGRARLLVILCAFVCFLIYVTNLKPYQNLMVVRIPDDDLNLPGPKGLYLRCMLCLQKIGCHSVLLLCDLLAKYSMLISYWLFPYGRLSSNSISNRIRLSPTLYLYLSFFLFISSWWK